MPVFTGETLAVSYLLYSGVGVQQALTMLVEEIDGLNWLHLHFSFKELFDVEDLGVRREFELEFLLVV